MVFKRFRDESRGNYGVEKEEKEGISLEQLNAGSLMRIADALEKLASKPSINTEYLENAIKRLEISIDRQNKIQERNEKNMKIRKAEKLHFENNITWLKGEVTKLKNQLKKREIP